MQATALSRLKAHLSKTDYSERLKSLEDVKRFLQSCYPSLEHSTMETSDAEDKKTKWIEVRSANTVVLQESDVGPVKPARLVLALDGTYTFQVMLKTVKTGDWKFSDEFPRPTELMGILDSMLANSGYVLCPGVRDYQAQFGEHVRFRTKSLREWNVPLARYDSSNCLLWHKPSNIKQPTSSAVFDCCLNCKTLLHDLTILKKRADSTSPGHKEKWLDTSSNRPFKYLSPASQKERLTRLSQEKRNLRKVLIRHDEPLDVALSCEQDKRAESAGVGYSGERSRRTAEDHG